jgi:hypothetical protein
MRIFVSEHEALLDISGILLPTENGYNFEGCWDLEAKIARMQGNFECIEGASPKNGVVRLEHVDDIKSDVLRVTVL